MELNPDQLEPAIRYKLMIGSIVPRPIAFVSTRSPEGLTNLAPFSFFNGVGSDPMTLLFCPSNKADGQDKDTLRNARPVEEGGTGQFVINLAAESYEREMAAAAEPLAFGESEFDLTGLATAPGQVVDVPRVALSPVAFECETMQVIRLNPGAPGGPNVVLGRVVHVYVRDDVVNEKFHVDAGRLATIGRMGGSEYCRLDRRFEMPFGKAALEP
jgi:flavin reductase (DIM6/NTAB) family NADH-FMN oxidoreductase RutF